MDRDLGLTGPTHRLQFVPDTWVTLFPFLGGVDAVEGVFGDR